jgi:Mycothiol maleylpyruvate isomerase N-terminal domain
MGAEILERANAGTEKVVANVTRDQLALGTPCASWQVRDVVNHLVGNELLVRGHRARW